MIEAFKNNWRKYLIEAWALGMFMVSAIAFTILFEYPPFDMPSVIPDAFLRRMFIALAMGLTAIALIYSKWGKQSGAHMNPAVTLANLHLRKINKQDAVWYMIAQTIGATFFVFLFRLFLPVITSDATVNYAVTIPGKDGVAISAFAEFIMSLILFLILQFVSNSRHAKYTGCVAGLLVFLFISFEAPLSGMSINPARSFGSAIVAGVWNDFWIYILFPVLGMQAAAFIFVRWKEMQGRKNIIEVL